MKLFYVERGVWGVGACGVVTGVSVEGVCGVWVRAVWYQL